MNYEIYLYDGIGGEQSIQYLVKLEVISLSGFLN